jgi:electron transfer flavoprotein beta subunit
MDVLVCVKRVPMVGGRIVLTPDGQGVDTKLLGFTVSPHEECAVEEAVRIVERYGGSTTVLTLGPPEAADQLRDAVAVGANHCLLLESDGREWGPVVTAEAIVGAVRRREAETGPFDLILLGNEAADTGDYQVGIRVAHALGRPVATGIKALTLGDRIVTATRQYRGVEERYELSLPAVVTVKEGINLPRYPSLPGRMRAKKAVIDSTQPVWHADGLAKEQLRVPVVDRRQAEVLGHGPDAVPALVALIESLGVLP